MANTTKKHNHKFKKASAMAAASFMIISLVLGRLDMGDVPMVGAGVVALLAGTLLGLRIHDQIPSEIFGKVIYSFVGIGGIWIIVSRLL